MNTNPVNVEPAGLLDDAHSIVGELLARLRMMVDVARQRQTQITQHLRKTARELDEVTARHRFAQSNQMPAAATLAAREQELRATYTTLEAQEQASQHALKQLDQLIRQIDMSSASLHGDSESEAADPWVLALRSQVILGREEERTRLAREVHDGPAQVLANTLMGAEQSRELLKEQRVDQLGLMLDRLCGATREGLHEVRRFISDLRPGRIEDLGLVAAIHEYIERYCKTHSVQVSFEADKVPSLLQEQEIVLYRVVQEALQNVHKHAAGASVAVMLQVRDQQLRLTIRDDGPGFDLREVARRAGRESWGFTSMRERVEMIGARLVVSSRPGSGTEVAVSLPRTSTTAR